MAKKQATVPSGYFEPVDPAEEKYPPLERDEETGEATGHAWVDPIVPDSAAEPDAKEEKK